MKTYDVYSSETVFYHHKIVANSPEEAEEIVIDGKYRYGKEAGQYLIFEGYDGDDFIIGDVFEAEEEEE